jgi:hypothetical protein
MMSATKGRKTVANLHFDKVEGGLGSFAMRHRRRRSSDGVDLDNAA